MGAAGRADLIGRAHLAGHERLVEGGLGVMRLAMFLALWVAMVAAMMVRGRCGSPPTSPTTHGRRDPGFA